MTKNFLFSFILCTFFVGSWTSINLCAVALTGETTPYAEIASMQQTDHSIIYGPIFNTNHAAYKKALYKERKSGITVVGSSRALEYHQDFFNQKITNCGRLVASLPSLLQFLDEVKKDDFTRTVIIVTDYWWFNGKLSKKYRAKPQNKSTGTEYTLEMVYQPIHYLLEGKIHLAQLIHHAYSKKRIGLRAIATGAGFTYEGARLMEKEKYYSPPSFEKMQLRLQQRGGADHFAYGTTVYPETIKTIKTKMEELEQAGKHVVAVFSPVSPALYGELITNTQYSYALKTVDYAQQHGFYNYLDPATIDTPTQEFVDFFHAGPRSAAKILLRLAQQDEHIREIVDTKAVTDFLKSGKPLLIPKGLTPGRKN